MIESWLERTYSADYPARLGPSASNLSPFGVDTVSKINNRGFGTAD
jgi:hypothetical protein